MLSALANTLRKRKLLMEIWLCFLVWIGPTWVAILLPSKPANLASLQFNAPAACSSFCLDNGDYCVFGANQDNTLEIGLLFVNKRHVLKTTWDQNATGDYARWISKYGSVTINFVGYQMVWAGMNEAGLMISTMSMNHTRAPAADSRPPFQGPFWIQYQLDNHSTVAQVIASDMDMRLVESAVDHYLVCDHTRACVVIEFLNGEMVAYTGENLPVKTLTNSTYPDSIHALEAGVLGGGQVDGNSLWRFTTIANRIAAFEPTSSDKAVAYAFDTLAAASRKDTVWSFVFDPISLRVHFRTNDNPSIRYLDFSRLDFSCRTPVRMLNVHADVSGDVSSEFVTYTHDASFSHSKTFFTQSEGYTVSPLLVDALLLGLESSACQEGNILPQSGLSLYHPLLPLTVNWAGLMILHRVGPFWIFLVALSLAFVIWRSVLDFPSSSGRRTAWMLVIFVLGLIGLLVYLLTRRKKRAKLVQHHLS